MAERRRQTSRGDRPPIEATLTADATYKLGDPIEVTFALRNTGNTPYQVLTWGTPLEGQTTNFLTVERNGEALPYDGPMVKRGDPTEDSYVVIAAGAEIKETVDISRSYPIDTPGDYTATLNATIHDAFPVQAAAKQAPRRRDELSRHELPATSVQFKVVPGGEARKTDGAQARDAEAKAKSGDAMAKGGALAKAKAPSFSGGTSQQQSDTVVAHDNAEYYTALAVQQLDNTTASTNILYQDWFGAFDQGRYDTVTGHYADINKVLNTEQVTYDFNGPQCTSSTFAYTYKGTRTVYLCALYLSAPQIGTDCKFGTLVHEWSHAVSSTDDHAYGETDAGNLADNDPGKAIDNADNHEYFTEHLAQSDFGKSLTYITDRSQFGKDEVEALLATNSPAVIEKAFYVHADGFWPDKLGITSTTLGSSPSVKPTLAMNPSIAGMTVEVASLEAEDTSLPVGPQRFTWVLRVKFTGSSGFPNAANTEKIVTLTATLAGMTASAQIRLLKEASPYELDGPTSWLSTDVRVFQIAANQSRFGATMGNSPAAASNFVKQVITNLTSGNSGGQTFDGISTDQQTSALELSQAVNGTNIYNFAIAKVRYVGTSAISNVRVFFRLFPVSSTSTEFALNTTYRRNTQGTTVTPLLGVSGGGDLLTIPCFADPRVDSATTSLTAQPDPSNVKPTMAASPPNAETVAYFGAWLDINQTTPQFPSSPSPANGPWSSGRKSIQTLIKNAHQCLVAEIAYDGDPIKDGASPGGSDKLAQRNLAIVASANPGDVASHRIPNVFELWPAAAIPGAPAPDELLIDWSNVPAGTTATIFIPEVKAEQIVTLAAGAAHGAAIRQVDDQTISLPTGGISYVPLPDGATFGLTGLLTVDLPETVKKGEVYHIVVRQVTDAIPTPGQPPPPDIVIRKADRLAGLEAVVVKPNLRWRRIVGSYQITIPVRTKEVMLPAETRLLSVLRWNLESMSTTERWYPVFSRYVSLIADRVGALGGDPDQVHGSPAGEPGGRGDEGDEGDGRDHGRDQIRECDPFDRGPTCRYDGKIVGIVYDCFGDFEGFILDDCGREIRFFAREHEIERLVRLAWRERIAISVVVRVAAKRRPISIILRHAPELVLSP